MSASESSSKPLEKLDRRRAVITLSMAAGLVLSYGTAALYGLRYLFGRQAPARRVSVPVASAEDVPEGKSLLREDLSGRKFLLVRRGENVRAFSTTCTHLGCQVHWKPEEKTFFCPCHDGVFDADGNPVSGPPPSPLPEYPVQLRNTTIFVTMPEA